MIHNRVPPAIEQAVIRDVVYEGYTQREAAKRHGIGLSTVNGILARHGWMTVGRRTIWKHDDGTVVPNPKNLISTSP
jgi:hypothetical protein